jgi:FkbM family methyltransferase
MTGWRRVIAIEAQERVFYALAGNISINNCFNAHLINAAVSSRPGVMKIPQPNYFVPSSFGSLELRQRPETEYIGQTIDYSDERMATVRTISIDPLGLRRLDVMKIDVEGMEAEALEGAAATIAASHPIPLIETLKSDMTVIGDFLSQHGYKTFNAGLNVVAIHTADPCINHVRQAEGA